MSLRIDAIDERILYRLAAEARHTSAPDIADELEVSAPTVRNRIRRLESAGVIEGYHAHVDYERVDGRLTNRVTCSTPGTDRERFARRILGVSGVVAVEEVMSGREDLLVTAVGTDTDDLARIARDIKALGVEVEDEDLVLRQHFGPYAPFGPADAGPVTAVSGIADLAGDATVVEITVGSDAPIAGQTLEQAGQRGLIEDGVLVITIERDDEPITPTGESSIRTGDRVTVLSRRGLSDETLHTFTGR